MFKARIPKHTEASVFTMPALEEDRRPLSRESIMQRSEEIQRRAYEDGFAAGEKAGYAGGEQKALVLIEGLEKIIDEITTVKDNLAEALEQQSVDLAVAIAKKIIIEEIKTRPEIIIAMVKEALKKLQRTGVITIKINPALHELFIKKKQELVDIHQDIVFEVISSVPVMGPLVISKTEEVVTDIDSLLAKVVEEMKAVTAAKGKGQRAKSKTESNE
ncbi:MAG: hypothetical protein HZB61_08730 [Nitrospirae bacterium]|nr:hypothetical protein [Nitrospirota bacterium]